MDWRTLIRDRRFQLAAGAVGALGLFVWWRKRGSSSSTSTTAGSGTTPAGTTSAAGFDSTATDLSATLGNFEQAQQGELNDFVSQLTTALQGLQTVPTQTTPSPVFTAPAPAAATGAPLQSLPTVSNPAPAPTPAQYVTVTKFTSSNPPWNSTLSGIAGHYGTTVANLLKLNPSITNANLIYPNQQVRVK